MYKVEMRERANEEVGEAVEWYQDGNGAAAIRFLEALENFYESLQRNPEAYHYLRKPLRQGKIEKYPFVVIFEVRGDIVIVFSVFHTRQDPAKKPSQ